jgi:excisionase family DNA binding protein
MLMMACNRNHANDLSMSTHQYNLDLGDGYREVLVVSPLRAVRLLAISRTTLYELLNRGELESFTIGKSRKITLASIHALIQRRVAAPDKKLTKIVLDRTDVVNSTSE